MSRAWPPVAIVLAAIAGWELVVRARHVPDYLVPAPSAVASTFVVRPGPSSPTRHR